jgi:hypothetical protein
MLVPGKVLPPPPSVSKTLSYSVVKKTDGRMNGKTNRQKKERKKTERWTKMDKENDI